MKKILKPIIGFIALLIAYSGVTRFLSRKMTAAIIVRIPERFKAFDTVVTFRGTKLKINTGDSVGRILYFMDEYKPVPTSFFESLLEPGMLFYDLGANLGMYTALAIKHGVRVVAFEPDPSLCQYYIRPTIELNHGEHLARVVCGAVSDTKGQISFWLHRLGNTGAGRVFKAEDMGDNPTIVVQSDTIDDYVKIYGKPNLIKIHIEGAEVLVIRGSEEIFEGPSAPILIIEFHTPDIAAIAPGTTPEHLIETLKSYGYKVAMLTEPKYGESTWHIFYKNELPKKSLAYFTPATQALGGYMKV